MTVEKPSHRMTLREMMIHSEKCSKEIIERIEVFLLPHLTEFRKLCRPVRHTSSYPTFLATRNALKKLHTSAEETREMAERLIELVQDIRKQAARERKKEL
jgi:hypothetical protein